MGRESETLRGGEQGLDYLHHRVLHQQGMRLQGSPLVPRLSPAIDWHRPR